MASSKVTPLPHNVPITDENGNPTPFFARTLQQLLDEKQNVETAVEAAQATADAAVPAAELLAQLVADLGGDPNADKMIFWDDSAGTFSFLEPGTALSITGTDLNASGGGGGGNWWTNPPVVSDFPTFFTSSGSNVAVTDDSDIGLKMLVNNAGDATFRTRGIAKAVPGSGAYSVQCRLQANGYRSNFYGAGLTLFETGTNKILSSSLTFDGSMYVDSWNGTLSAFGARGNRYIFNDGDMFLRVDYDGTTNYTLYFSENGKDWLQSRQIIRTTPFTTAATHVGLAVTIQNNPASAATQGLSCDYWSQSW